MPLPAFPSYFRLIKRKRSVADCRGIHDLALKLGGFTTGTSVTVERLTRMTPLSKRTVGSFMSPLKMQQGASLA
jgi:hypothetical protein